MEKTQTKNSKNGTKPIWERPIEKDKFTEEEIELIKASRAVLKVIDKQIARGDYDEYFREREEAKK